MEGSGLKPLIGQMKNDVTVSIGLSNLDNESWVSVHDCVFDYIYPNGICLFCDPTTVTMTAKGSFLFHLSLYLFICLFFCLLIVVLFIMKFCSLWKGDLVDILQLMSNSPSPFLSTAINS